MTTDQVLQKDLDQAAATLRKGGLIAFPTETYYGLAVDPFNESALHRLFDIKQRPSVKPVLLLVSARGRIAEVADGIPVVAERLMDRYWPGPLTMVFSARSELPATLTGDTGTIGVRVSSNPVANSLLHIFGGPLTATSANRSGEDAARTETEVRKIFGRDIDMILPGGPTPGGKPSTLVAFEENSIICIRDGCIPCREIFAYVREAEQSHQQ